MFDPYPSTSRLAKRKSHPTRTGGDRVWQTGTNGADCYAGGNAVFL
jgi:hypothetical protein